MKQEFKLLNIKCDGCANSLKKALIDDFGEIDVDLDVMPRVVSLDIDDSDIDKFREVVKKLGYPFADEDMGLFDETTTKAKSFVSCAIGKIDL